MDGAKCGGVHLQALRDVQSGTRILYVICAEGKANKNLTIANLVRPPPSLPGLQSAAVPHFCAAAVPSVPLLYQQWLAAVCLLAACTMVG